jgi:hypothetical protein
LMHFLLVASFIRARMPGLSHWFSLPIATMLAMTH